MTQTPFTIRPKSGGYAVYNGDKLKTQGHTDIESALHAIWVEDGMHADRFFHQENGTVFLDVVHAPGDTA